MSQLGAYRMVDNSWSEYSMTWNDASTDVRLITMVYYLSAYQWAQMDVSASVNRDSYTIGLGTNDNDTYLGFYSRESQDEPLAEIKYVSD